MPCDLMDVQQALKLERAASALAPNWPRKLNEATTTRALLAEEFQRAPSGSARRELAEAELRKLDAAVRAVVLERMAKLPRLAQCPPGDWGAPSREEQRALEAIARALGDAAQGALARYGVM